MLKPEIVTARTVEAAVEWCPSSRSHFLIATHHENQWLAFPTKVLALVDENILVDFPARQVAEASRNLLGNLSKLIIKSPRYRYFGQCLVQPESRWQVRGEYVSALSMHVPAEFKRFDRRLRPRLEVPSSMGIRGSVWLGDDQELRWAGAILNLSVGGMQMRTSSHILEFLDPGETVSISLVPGPGAQPILIGGYFRGGNLDGEMALAGLKFGELQPQKQAAIGQIIERISR